ncbi:MAG: T9SS type A sorting domain-containing protein [Chitinophagaceae bacterium]|nr:T9SS type A sorting domain-containing protein [Chitinophagaceae bacterium]
MKSILLASFLFLLLSENVSAQGFTGDYTLPGNWQQTLTSNGSPSGLENTGSVTISPGFDSFTINGSNDDSNPSDSVDVDFTIVATTAGIWAFDWYYQTFDGTTQPSFDSTFVLVNGIKVDALSTDGGGDIQSGTYTSSFAVSIGDEIGVRLRSIDNQGGNAILTISSFVAPGGILPVRLDFFNAKQSGEQVKIDWATQSESNSDRFEVERSTNGKDFKVIATIRAAGNSTLTQNYSAIDNNPENGNNYYRLRQVDLDGKFTYSMIKTLKWSTLELVKLYPNPVRNMVNVRFTPERNETTAITLFDGSGKTLQRRNIAAVAGSNMVTAWNVEGLAPGIYFFRINGISAPLRFVKQ